MTKWEYGSSTDRYVYDRNGNFDSVWSGTHYNKYRYQSDNQLDSVMLDGVVWLKGFTYDSCGSATWARHNNNLLDLTHDIYGQMRNVHDTTTVWDQVTYGYSPGGLRVWKWLYQEVDTCDEGGGGESFLPPPPCEPYMQSDWTYYVRGQGGKVLAEFADLAGSPTARYIYAGSQRIAMVDSSNNVYYYLNDHLGSAGVLITSTGTVRDKYKYKPFGDNNVSSIVDGQAYRYTGKPLDEELDLDWYYYGARYYGPEIGRFLAVDPLNGKYPGWSPYVYTLNNPLKYTDPDGRAPSGATLGDIVYAAGNPVFGAVSYMNQSTALSESWLNTPGATPLETPGRGRGDRVDAARHALWAGLNARDLGSLEATKIALMHEGGYDPNDASNVQDMLNSQIGIQIAQDNPGASQEELIDLILEAAGEGELVDTPEEAVEATDDDNDGDADGNK